MGAFPPCRERLMAGREIHRHAEVTRFRVKRRGMLELRTDLQLPGLQRQLQGAHEVCLGNVVAIVVVRDALPASDRDAHRPNAGLLEQIDQTGAPTPV